MRSVIALFCATMVLGLGLSDAHALPGTPHERAQVFATCSGRLSAMATRQRAERNPAAARTEEIRAGFEMLLDATLPAAIDRGVPVDMAVLWHAAGWHEIAYLLADVHYSADPGRVRRARDRMQARLDDCREMLLPRG